MQRFTSRLMVSILVALLLAAGLPPDNPLAAQEPASIASTGWTLEKVGTTHLSPVAKLAVTEDGVPLAAYWAYDSALSTRRLVVARREAGKWVDLEMETSCPRDYMSLVNFELGVDKGQNVYLAYICIGRYYDDLRVARYDKATQEWRTEMVDDGGRLWFGSMHSLSMTVQYLFVPAVGYVLNTGEVRHAWREKQDQWNVSVVSTSAGSFSNTAVGGPASIAYSYSQDGTVYAAQAVLTDGAWKSAKGGEGSVFPRSHNNCLAFQKEDKMYFAMKGDDRYTSTLVADRSERPRLDVRHGCNNSRFVFMRNGGLTFAHMYIPPVEKPGLFDSMVRRLIPDCTPKLADFMIDPEDYMIAHALLVDGSNAVYYTSGTPPHFISLSKARVRPDGGPISINNATVPDGTNTPFVEGDKVVAYPAAVKKISYNAACVKGFVEIIALQVRPHLPEKYQQLSNTQIAFMILLSSTKLGSFLEAVCQEDAPQAARAPQPDVTEDPYLLLDMESGAMSAVPMHADFILDVRTPLATCRTTGGSTAVIAHDPNSNTSFFHVTAGSAIVTPADTQHAPFTLQAGKAAEISPSGIEWMNIAPPLFLPYIVR